MRFETGASRRFDHVVWDWNGTLLDDAELCVRAMNQMLGKRGLPPITHGFYRSVLEFPVEGYYRKLGFDFSQEPFETVSNEFVALYQAGWRGCFLQPGALGVMAALREAGVGQSVLSASKSDYLLEQLDHFGVTPFLEFITGADNHHGRGKLGLARGHVEKTGVAPDRIVFVGDTLHDAEVAREAGSACLPVAFGHYSIERFGGLGFPPARGMHEVLGTVLNGETR